MPTSLHAAPSAAITPVSQRSISGDKRRSAFSFLSALSAYLMIVLLILRAIVFGISITRIQNAMHALVELLDRCVHVVTTTRQVAFWASVQMFTP